MIFLCSVRMIKTCHTSIWDARSCLCLLLQQATGTVTFSVASYHSTSHQGVHQKTHSAAVTNHTAQQTCSAAVKTWRYCCAAAGGCGCSPLSAAGAAASGAAAAAAAGASPSHSTVTPSMGLNSLVPEGSCSTYSTCGHGGGGGNQDTGRRHGTVKWAVVRS